MYCIQTLRHTLLFIAISFSLAFLTKCNTPISTYKATKKTALYLANNIDSSSISFLKKYSFGKRGEVEFWQRVSADSNLYFGSYKLKNDTVELTFNRPFNFVKDFACSFKFDTSLYNEFRFSKLNDMIVGIGTNNNYGQEQFDDTLFEAKKLFPNQDPFATFSILTNIKDKYSFIGTSYRSDIGDFIEFWISPQFKLTYLPDTINMNLKFRKYWLNDFYKGEIIKEHWSLQKVYD